MMTTLKTLKHIVLSHSVKTLLVLVAFTVTLASCSDDDEPAAPVITNFEYGEGSTHSTDPVAYKGFEIHLEADIVAAGTIQSIVLEIHSHDATPGDGEVAWDFEQTYTAKYQVKNATFHEHVDIPGNIPAGEYHVELIVTDKNGRSTEVEGHLEILNAPAI